MKASYESLIRDDYHICLFYHHVLKGLEASEVNFLSAAARTKYLTKEQREKIRLGKTQMLGKTLIKRSDYKSFYNQVQRLDAESSFYTDYDGHIIPRECMVMYVNINPSSALKALYEFKKILCEYEMEATRLLLHNTCEEKKSEYFERIKTVINRLYSCFQVARSRKRWIDIDCDIHNVNTYNVFKTTQNYASTLEGFKDSKIFGIATRGGLHILVRTEGLKDNPEKLVKFINTYVRAEGGSIDEIKINKNEMVPLPGTSQGGVTVKFYVGDEGELIA